jgi:hypothetical protein
MAKPTITYQTMDGRTITVEAVYRGVKGYADEPGTGPAGETCKTCQHLVTRSFAKNYFKCGLTDYTGGPGTDIRKSSPACSKWEIRTIKEEAKCSG